MKTLAVLYVWARGGRCAADLISMLEREQRRPAVEGDFPVPPPPPPVTLDTQALVERQIAFFLSEKQVDGISAAEDTHRPIALLAFSLVGFVVVRLAKRLPAGERSRERATRSLIVLLPALLAFRLAAVLGARADVLPVCWTAGGVFLAAETATAHWCLWLMGRRARLWHFYEKEKTQQRAVLRSLMAEADSARRKLLFSNFQEFLRYHFLRDRFVSPVNVLKTGEFRLPEAFDFALYLHLWIRRRASSGNMLWTAAGVAASIAVGLLGGEGAVGLCGVFLFFACFVQLQRRRARILLTEEALWSQVGWLLGIEEHEPPAFPFEQQRDYIHPKSAIFGKFPPALLLLGLNAACLCLYASLAAGIARRAFPLAILLVLLVATASTLRASFLIDLAMLCSQAEPDPGLIREVLQRGQEHAREAAKQLDHSLRRQLRIHLAQSIPAGERTILGRDSLSFCLRHLLQGKTNPAFLTAEELQLLLGWLGVGRHRALELFSELRALDGCTGALHREHDHVSMAGLAALCRARRQEAATHGRSLYRDALGGLPETFTRAELREVLVKRLPDLRTETLLAALPPRPLPKRAVVGWLGLAADDFPR